MKHISIILLLMYTTLNSVVASGYKSYKEIFLEHSEHTSDKWENYLDIYELYLRPYINKNASIMEVGVQNGGHLQILKKYLHNGKIYGADIDNNVCKMDLGSDIKTFCFDATKADAIEQDLKELSFDVIIDDASHKSQNVIKTFQLMFSRVKPGGIYIIEDLHASYWKEFDGGYKSQHSQVEYLKSLLDLLNAYHVKKGDTYLSKDTDFFDNLTTVDKQLFEWINSITFYDSVCVIQKLKFPRSQAYKRITVGTKQPVVPMVDIAKSHGFYHEQKH
ncbi:MAG: methyltransferase domain-containing protein [Rickettsiaceae bacterium]